MQTHETPDFFFLGGGGGGVGGYTKIRIARFL